MILVDDGSTDRSFDIAVNYAKQYDFIHLIHTKNGGLASARNYGINIARGDYLIFLDSDDYWGKGDIFKELENIIIEKHYPDIIFNPYRNESKNEHRFFDVEGLTGEYVSDFTKLVQKWWYISAVWTKIVKRDVVIKNKLYFSNGFVHEDTDWTFKLAFFIKNYTIYHHNFYVYRQREGSLSFKPKLKSITDSSFLLSENILYLYKNKISHPKLLEGLKIFLQGNINYINGRFQHLSEEDKQIAKPVLDNCVSLFQQLQEKI